MTTGILSGMAQNLDITATAQALAAGACCATDLLDRALARIERYQKALNAFVDIDRENARRAAAAAAKRHRQAAPLSPLDGIPIGLKDNINVEGLTTRNGTALSFPFTEEADVTKRLRAAGAVLLGKLNMDECALGAITDNPHHGRTYNPWRTGYTAGGSSGGAGAAVASGMVMAALGTDTLGSVRLPAAYCGIVGLKPTHGSVSTRGVVPLCPSFDDVGPLCRTVRDAALMFSILTETAPEDWSDKRNLVSDLSNLRIGIFEQVRAADLTPEVANGFEQALATLGACGAMLETISVSDVDFGKLRRRAFLMIENEGAKNMAEPLRRHPEAFSDAAKAMFDFGRNVAVEKLSEARSSLEHVKTITANIFNRVDLLISPTAPQNAFALAELTPTNQADLTALANICGCPAVSLPSGLGPSGLPQAVQLIAPAHQEAKLLNSALIMERLWGTFSPSIES